MDLLLLVVAGYLVTRSPRKGSPLPFPLNVLGYLFIFLVLIPFCIWAMFTPH